MTQNLDNIRLENELAKACIDKQISALSRLHYVVMKGEYAQILDAIVDKSSKRDGKVIIAGVGKNSHVASKISDTLVSLGIPSIPLNISHCAHGDFGRVEGNDIVIHISRSGTTAEMVEAIAHIRWLRPTTPQFLIHCKGNKTKHPDTDIELFIGDIPEGDEHALAPTTSTTALLCLLDTLAVQASHALGFTRRNFLEFHPGGALGKMLRDEQDSKASER